MLRRLNFFDEGDWNYGIAYDDYIICGCCGGLLEISEIEELAKEMGVEDPIQELEWVNLAPAIKGV